MYLPEQVFPKGFHLPDLWSFHQAIQMRGKQEVHQWHQQRARSKILPELRKLDRGVRKTLPLEWNQGVERLSFLPDYHTLL